MGAVTESTIREKRDALARDQAALAATGRLRSDRDSQRAADAAAEATSSQAASAEAVSQCFVARPAARGGANERVLRRVFHAEERRARERGRAGAGRAELAAALEACTGCAPRPAEVRAMLAGRDTVDVDAFLAIYRDVRAGALPFENLARAMAAFAALCAAIPDTAAVA